MDKKKDWVNLQQARTVAFATVLTALTLSEKFKTVGDELVGMCPFHMPKAGDERPTFGINPDKGLFNCFVCKRRGNVLDFVMAYQKVSVKEAGKWLLGLDKREEKNGHDLRHELVKIIGEEWNEPDRLHARLKEYLET